VTVPERLSRVVSAHWFTTTVLVVIVVNAVVLGLETYEGVDDRYGDELDLVNGLCFVVFVVELTLRIGAYGRRPWLFFRDGWNVFDFIVADALRDADARELPQRTWTRGWRCTRGRGCTS
jgi:voltage-gated sodium channel